MGKYQILDRHGVPYGPLFDSEEAAWREVDALDLIDARHDTFVFPLSVANLSGLAGLWESDE